MREYEQQLVAKDQLVNGLRAQLEREQEALKEHKEDIKRERERRRKFEEELEEDREGLREQMQQLKAVLNGASEMPSMEDFEDMESEELLEYIGDVEQEKQRVEGAKGTIDTQRDQLETLLNISKNLKAQVAHLKERQDPLRNLVERLNLQEKILIRFIRINYDRSFMPSQAYEKEEE